MKTTKKILLPEVKPPRRIKRKPETAQRIEHPALRKVPGMISDKQRSEAIGLVMIGFSAFFISLLHYLNSSKVVEQVNSVIVILGVGVYIMPILTGLMGVQRFLDRPFRNLGLRVLGSAGVMTFGLGLLGLEGGKLGIYTFDLFARLFGTIPSRLLFLFLALSSLIFALDILYKDILAAGLIITGLVVKFCLLAWEGFLALLALLIGALRTSSDLLKIIVSRVADYLSNDPLQEEDAYQPSGNGLIAFNPGFITRGTQDTSDPPEEASENYTEDKPRTEIKTGKASSRTSQPEVPTTQNFEGQIPEKFVTETSYSVEFVRCSGTMPSVTATVPVDLVESITDQVVNPTAVAEELQVYVELEKKTPQALLQQAEDRETESEAEEEPIDLEDNLIDKEIKSDNDKERVAPRQAVETPLPPIDLLHIPPPRECDNQSELSERSALLVKTLEEFGIKASVTAIVEGPAVSRFELKPAPGVKVSRITSLTDDIALALAAQAIRVEAPIPGKQALGIEIPNPKPVPVYFHDLVKHDRFKSANFLNLALGVTISGQPVYADLADMPHLLIAGSTGSGKSVCVNTIIASILFQARSNQVKLLMIDPKMVELSSYNGIPHLISPVVTDPSQAAGALLWAVEEMERRYEVLADCGMRKISTYNKEIDRIRRETNPELEMMSYIVIIIDELADLMMTASAEVEGSICRLAQMARAVGIHLVIATQRPSVNVLTGLIKANLPSRIAFSVASHIDSRTILDIKGAERLLGKGDMLFVPKGRNKPLRLQGAFISDRELMDITEFVKSQGDPEYLEIAPVTANGQREDDPDDEDETQDSSLMSRIEKYLETEEKTSTSMLQRKFRIGYNRAARIMDILEEKGVVSPLDGSNKRRVIGRRSVS